MIRITNERFERGQNKMRKQYSLLFTLIVTAAVGFHTAGAQIQIRIPKIPKTDITVTGSPKTQPTPERPKTEGPNTDAARPGVAPGQTTDGRVAQVIEGTTYTRPEPTNQPVFLRDTIEVQLKTKETYWKVPNQNYYTSWVPRVKFQLVYNNSAKLRYTAEWFNPDGSPWFTESLNYGHGNGIATMMSEYSDELMQTKAAVTTGTFGFKITNPKTNEVSLQGKFKVSKMLTYPGEARYRNRAEFFVDNDWNLPIGYVGFSADAGWTNPPPVVFMWFKGRLEAKDFEARLFLKGEEIASTDDHGIVNVYQYRGEDCLRFPDTCRLQQFGFYWQKFIVENSNWVRNRKPDSIFTRDKPGEYTVKVFHKGLQVREVRFTIEADGKIARNAFSAQMPLADHKIVVPVKIMGNLDKWNSATWKIDAFYGNPIPGFGV
jgi:hypothetical protein